MKLYTLFNRTVLVILLGLVYLNTKSQEKKRMLLEFSGNPIATSFKKDYSMLTFNTGVSYFVTEKLNLGLQFHENYELNKNAKTYNYLSSIGLSVGYNFFPNKENSFWEDGSFELMSDIGGGSLNSNRDTYFLYGNLSFRLYYLRTAFIGIGYEHKWYNEDAILDNSHNLFFVFGFRL